MKYLKVIVSILLVLTISIMFTACVKNNADVQKNSNKDVQDNVDNSLDNSLNEEKELSNNEGLVKKVEENVSNEENNKDSEVKEKVEEKQVIDYNTVKPNEIGEIMVLMYHRFGEEESKWCRTFDNFKKDLNVLYEKGYRLISMNDFLTNNIDVPVGTTPVIFTFDDGATSQFNLIEKNGKLVLNPKSAVGIMMEFYKEHPDFGFEGTFYINETPFPESKGTEKERLKYLLDLGLDIGNHTYAHTNLGKADAMLTQKVIGQNVKKIKEYFPDYKFNTLALPYGSYRKDTFKYVEQGKYKGIEYKNDAILLVGWKPSPPPYHRDFYALKMLRVRACEGIKQDMYYYLDDFDKYPEKKYKSDGDKNTICFPEEYKNKLNVEAIGDKEIITY